MWSANPSPTSRRGILRRAVFSEEQRKELERTFRRQKYISKTDRNKLAANLSLKESQVIEFKFMFRICDPALQKGRGESGSCYGSPWRSNLNSTQWPRSLNCIYNLKCEANITIMKDYTNWTKTFTLSHCFRWRFGSRTGAWSGETVKRRRFITFVPQWMSSWPEVLVRKKRNHRITLMQKQRDHQSKRVPRTHERS